MRSVVLISLITFVLIFGGMLLLTTHLQHAAGETEAQPQLGPEDYAAAERLLQDLAVERDRIQREKEKLLALQQQLAVETKLVNETKTKLAEVIAQLREEQQIYNAEKEKSARRLAKMYEAMKPGKAAPILSALDMDIILEILTRMKEKPAAKILSYMDASLAARISTRLSYKGAS
jgi:flagellar motility protein MotE (MotC chaperone)